MQETTYKCDQCERSFTSEQQNGPDGNRFTCISDKAVMPIFLGYRDGYGTMVGYDFGDMCKYCQEELKNLVEVKFPNIKLIKLRD